MCVIVSMMFSWGSHRNPGWKPEQSLGESVVADIVVVPSPAVVVSGPAVVVSGPAVVASTQLS